MQVIHHVSKSVDLEQRNELLRLGFDVDTGLITFDVDEIHPSWPELRVLIRRWNAVDIVRTKFTLAETNQAHHLRMAATSQQGYPQPDNDFGYLNASFDLPSYCRSCGIAKVQNAPIRMAREPEWRSRDILQLNWLHDEYFTKPEIWEELFKPFGINCSPVIDNKTENELKTVVQINTSVIADSPLLMPDHVASTRCPECGKLKYEPITRGFYPPFVKDVQKPLSRSHEFFGSGAAAWRAIIISSSLFAAIKGKKIKGVEFFPLSLGK